MEPGILVDAGFASLCIVASFVLRRVFTLFDRLVAEDKQLHDRITKVQTTYVSKYDFDQAVDRILESINRVEQRMNESKHGN
jgi:uncharacterized membrane protein YhiD involved in acid resistance